MTSTSSTYYLQYRTWNQGKTDYYPFVKSTVNDYAGASGKPIQQVQIQAYKSDGTKLSSNIVVMYRAFVNGAWQAWVSNADPEWMRSVQSKYALGGTLDFNGSYAGISGKSIGGIEIHVFEEGSLGDFTGGETTSTLSYMVDSASNWIAFDKSTLALHFNGIRIQTSVAKPYYISYQTWNAGQASYYPAVKSTDVDYAGSAGKPVQRVKISAYKTDGTKLTSEVIVMYRAYVDGTWLPWVSNSDPEWMRSVQNKYALGGVLDISDLYYLETAYKNYYDSFLGPAGGMLELGLGMQVEAITNFLRSQEYKGTEWFFTTLHPIDGIFVDLVKSDESELSEFVPTTPPRVALIARLGGVVMHCNAVSLQIVSMLISSPPLYTFCD